VPERLSDLLSAQTGESVEWPSDEVFREAWRSQHVYHVLNNPKVVHIFKRLNNTYLGNKMESLEIEGAMTVERDGTKGMNFLEFVQAELDDPRAIATQGRNTMLQTFGNLTILTQPLNSSVSNSAWTEKKPELLRHSLLPINQQLQDVTVWDEAAIKKRSDELFKRALKLWPRS
jgi:hypothetical protein